MYSAPHVTIRLNIGCHCKCMSREMKIKKTHRYKKSV